METNYLKKKIPAPLNIKWSVPNRSKSTLFTKSATIAYYTPTSQHERYLFNTNLYTDNKNILK